MMKKQLPALAIVVPCFNEESVLPETINRLTEKLQEYIESVSSTPPVALFL